MARKFFGTDGIRGRTNEGVMTAATAMRVMLAWIVPSSSFVRNGPTKKLKHPLHKRKA